MKRKGIDWNDPEIVLRLGREPDGAIGKDYGVTRERVRQVREQLSISSNASRRRALFTNEVPRLGKEPDYVIAREIGYSGPAVCNLRNRMGIPPYTRPVELHGYNAYVRGCRCVECKAANAQRMRVYYRKKRAKTRGMSI